MKSRWLAPFAAGTATGVAAFLAPWAVFHSARSEQTFVLEYRRNTSWVSWPEPKTDDPGARFPRITDYPIFLADKCKIGAWEMTDNLSTADADQTIWLRVDMRKIDDDQFACLANHIQPPFVRLRRESENNAQTH